MPTKGSSWKIHLECVTFFQNERVKTEITCAALSKGIWWESNLTVFFLAVECYSWSKNYGFMKTLIHFLLIYVLSSKKEALGSNALWLLKGNIFSVFSAYLYKCAELSYQSFFVRALKFLVACFNNLFFFYMHRNLANLSTAVEPILR